MIIRSSWLGESIVAKAIILLVAFLFVVTSAAPAFAQEAPGSSAPQASEVAPPDRQTSQPTTVTEPAPSTEVGVPTTDVSDPMDQAAPSDSQLDVSAPTTEEPLATDPKKQAPTTQTLNASAVGTPAENSNKSLTDVVLPNTDKATGALNYKYPITVPPGRGAMTPDAGLTYNSQEKRDGILGIGWSVNIPYIERINKTGSDQMYTQNYFNSSMDGELTSINSTDYGPEVENGQFLKYTLSSNSWTVTDKNGTVYKFGNQAATRMDNPSDSAKVFRWMLEETRDTNNNYITYEYYKDGGQIYPSKITYTGNDTTPGIFTVNFDRVARTYSFVSYTPGFAVTTSYRISQIRTEVSTVWARKYDLAYAAADNGISLLLNTITESGQDDSAVVTALPATDFDYKTSTPGWTYNSYSSTNSPLPFLNSDNDIGLRMADINGDGLVDLLCHNKNTATNGIPCSNPNPKIYLNTGVHPSDPAWVLSTSWTFPGTGWLEGFTSDTYADTGLRLADVNGDGYTDFLKGTFSQKSVWLNNKINGWTLQTTNWSLPLAFLSGQSNDNGLRVQDINGDGLPDLVCHNAVTTSGTCNNNNPQIWINNGTGWTQSTTWQLPYHDGGTSGSRESFTNSNYLDTGLRFEDLNGDGLMDLIKSNEANNNVVYLNNGTNGWTYDSAWGQQRTIIKNGDYGYRAVDINSDGLADIMCHNNQGTGACHDTAPEIYLNTGNHTTYWQTNTSWQFPYMNGGSSGAREAFISSSGTDTGLRVVDINGDGTNDLVRWNNAGSNYRYNYFNNNSVDANLLTKINYPQGGNTTVAYKATGQFMDGSSNVLNPNLPVIIDVVSQITNDDGSGNIDTKTFSYEGGKYYFNTYLDRKLSGFSKSVETDSAGNVTKTYYHQGDTSNTTLGEYQDDISKIRKPYRVERYDNASNLYAVTINKWDKYDLGSGRNFIKNIRTTELTYDGDSDHKDKAEEYTYDNTYGNLTEKVEWGEVTGSNDGAFIDTGTDKFTTTISYATNTTPYIVDLPSQDTKVDQSANKVRENKYYYDAQTLGSVTDGNLTKQEMWKTASTYVDIEKTYNTTYGIVTQEKDPRDKATNYSYDSYNLYPATVTNPLSQATSYTYDYSSGQVKQVTNPNTRVYQTVFDGLDRIKEQKQPDLTTPSTLVTKTAYVYTDTSGAVKIQKIDNLDGSTSIDTYTYFDGLNRPIQVRREMEDTNTYATTDTVYNNIGQIYKQSLPYSSSGSAKTSATTTTALFTTNSYDPMLRIASTVTAVGTTSNAYDDWKLTITDPRTKTKDLYKDAYGNLIKVDEHNGANTYTTNYEYNGNNKLTKITDALSNVRNFTYDGLGRRLTAQDLHASADATFGSYTYTYDDSGNLSSIVDQKSQTINYTYDDINRVATEDYTGQAETEVTYTYDSGTDGIGKLTSVIATGANTTNAYDANGNRKQEIKTINSTAYQTDFIFDRQGNQLEITNPDSSKVKYTYNTAGQLETVQRKESTDGAFINLVTDFDYGPHGKVTYQAYQNGAATTNTYDSTKMYRLSNKTTTITGGSKMQDLTYTYDANSNITKIVDASNTNSSKSADYTYDDLNRLLSATITAVAGGQSTYTHNYTYSAIGNILTRTDAAGSYSYAGDTGSIYANPHAVTSVGAISYTYDDNGNMLTETSGLSNSWDYNNCLTQAIKSGITSTYSYDHAGQRVKLANGTTTTYYPSQFYNTDGTNIIKHITTPDGQDIATVKGTGASAAIYSVHTDHLTGANVITNSSGSQEELLDYFPYGNIRLDQKAGSFGEKQQFAGSEFDADSSLNYMEARYYHSAIGRFISQDSAFLALGDNSKIKDITDKELQEYLSDPQSLNSYTYARNNPLYYIDPTGQFWNPFNSIQGAWFTTVGNVANSYAKHDPIFNYATNHAWVGYTAGGIGLAAGIGAGVLYGGAALGYGALAQAGSYCLFACGQISRTDYTSALNWATNRGINSSSLPTRQEIANVADKWENTSFDSKAQSILYHFDKHANGNTLSGLTRNGLNVWNSFINKSSIVSSVNNALLKSGEIGLKINTSTGAGGIFTKTGKIVTTWFK